MLCAVFDLDDTLYLERAYVWSGFRAAGAWAEKELGIRDFSERSLYEFECGHRGDIFNRVLSAYGLSNSKILAELVQAYRSHAPSIALLPDAIQCLSALRDHGFLAVITDGAVEAQQKKVRALGLDSAVNLVVLTGKWGQEFSKPNARAFEYVQQQFGVPPGRCAYIGDNPTKDFITPRGLGWRTARVRRDGGLHSRRTAQAGYDAEREFKDLSQVPAMLLGC
jgi:putative hydrolase of the HAD superfamily